MNTSGLTFRRCSLGAALVPLTISSLLAGPVLILMAAPTAARAQDASPASASDLAGIRLPSGAVRIRESSIPDTITKALGTMMEGAGPRVRQGKVEVLAWTGKDLQSAGIGALKSRVGADLKSAGWEYEEAKDDSQPSLTLVSALRTKPTRRGILGFWAQNDDTLVLAWVETIPVASEAPATQTPPPSTSEAGEERSIKGILAGLGGPYVPTPPPPEEYRVKSKPTASPAVTKTRNTSVASAGGAAAITLSPTQLSVNVMKNAMPAVPSFPALSPKPGVVRGYVRDSKGRPLQGAVIGVRSSAAGGFYSGASGKTDARGYYEVQVPWGGADFYTASVTRDYGDGRAAFGLHPADDEADTFASARGAVENWVLLPYGVADRDAAQDDPKYSGNYYGGTLSVSYSVGDPRFSDDYSLPNGAEIELRLTPDGPLMDGNPGRPFVFRRRVQEGTYTTFYINNVPVGRYQISAHLLQSGGSAPLRIRETGPQSSQPFGLEPKEGTEGVTLTFRPGGAKAGMSPAARGNWSALDITLKR